jgi:hypothetical protein
LKEANAKKVKASRSKTVVGAGRVPTNLNVSATTATLYANSSAKSIRGGPQHDDRSGKEHHP